MLGKIYKLLTTHPTVRHTKWIENFMNMDDIAILIHVYMYIHKLPQFVNFSLLKNFCFVQMTKIFYTKIVC